MGDVPLDLPDEGSGRVFSKPTREKETRVGNKTNGDHGIYCGRGSVFGNPYTSISDRHTKAEFIVGTREESLERFKEYFYKRIEEDANFSRAVSKLKGETLLCFCRPALSCHCDTIKEYLDSH